MRRIPVADELEVEPRLDRRGADVHHLVREADDPQLGSTQQVGGQKIAPRGMFADPRQHGSHRSAIAIKMMRDRGSARHNDVLGFHGCARV